MNFGEFKALLLDFLRADADTTYPDSLLFQAYELAADAINPWIPCQAVADLTSGSTNEIDLPIDLWKIEAVQDYETGEFLPRFLLSPRMPLPPVTTTPYLGGEKLSWSEFPRGKLYFSMTPEESKVFRLFYCRHYGKPSNEQDDSFVLETPTAALSGIIYFAASHCVMPHSIVSSQIRQFNTRVDAGTPVDNVLENTVKMLRTMFMQEMDRLPKYSGAAQ